MNTNGPVALVFILAWMFGIAIAKGFWLVTSAIFIPPVAWVILAQWIIERTS